MVKNKTCYSNRRKLLKSTGTLITAGLAGCSGGGSDGSGNKARGTTTTASQTKEEDLSPQEWRKLASEKAAEELKGEKLVYYMTSREETYRDMLENIPDGFPDSEIYEPLSGKISMVSGGSSESAQKYIREYNAEGQTKVDVLGLSLLSISNQVEFGNLTPVPAFRNSPDYAKVGNFRGSQHLFAAGLNYNSDLVSDPPTSYEELVNRDDLKDEIFADFTPATDVIGAHMVKHDDSWFEKFNQQSPKLIKSGWGITKRTGQGQGKIAFHGWLPHAFRGDREGLPLDYVKSPEVWHWRGKPIFMSAQPPHPWAAKLFIDMHLRPEAPTQAPRPGSISVDASQGKPNEITDIFNGEVWNIKKVKEKLGMDSAPEINKRYQKLINAPTV